MIDPNILKDNPDVLEENIKRRNLDISINPLKSLTKQEEKLGLMQMKLEHNRRS